MKQGIDPGLIPPPRGLEKEEPDLWQEDDIPSDSRGEQEATRDQAGDVESR